MMGEKKPDKYCDKCRVLIKNDLDLFQVITASPKMVPIIGVGHDKHTFWLCQSCSVIVFDSIRNLVMRVRL